MIDLKELAKRIEFDAKPASILRRSITESDNKIIGVFKKHKDGPIFVIKAEEVARNDVFVLRIEMYDSIKECRAVYPIDRSPLDDKSIPPRLMYVEDSVLNKDEYIAAIVSWITDKCNNWIGQWELVPPKNPIKAGSTVAKKVETEKKIAASYIAADVLLIPQELRAVYEHPFNNIILHFDDSHTLSLRFKNHMNPSALVGVRNLLASKITSSVIGDIKIRDIDFTVNYGESAIDIDLRADNTLLTANMKIPPFSMNQFVDFIKKVVSTTSSIVRG